MRDLFQRVRSGIDIFQEGKNIGEGNCAVSLTFGQT